ncbi:MAG: dihydroorotase family protein [Fervidicoccaceae archaeon]
MSRSVKLVVRGKAFVAGEIARVTIAGNEQGLVEKIELGSSNSGRGEEELDFDKPGYLIAPGVVDLHVHLRDWGQSAKETVRSGTAAAAAGGVVAVADMPNTLPPVDTLERALERDRLLGSGSYVDYVLYAKPPRDPVELEEMLKVAIGLKIYPEDLRRAEHLPPSPPGALFVFHAESPECIEGVADVKRGHRPGEERPGRCEIEAVERILSSPAFSTRRIHVTHATLCESIELIERARRGGARVTVDATPHHLLLDARAYTMAGSVAKVYPPLRLGAHTECLRTALLRGVLDAVSSDHAPHEDSEKSRGYWEAPPGIPGLETLVPLAFTTALRLEMPIERLFWVLSRGPAKILGLGDVLGEIAVGKLASFTVLDVRGWRRVRGTSFRSSAKLTPFEGWELTGWPHATIVRSELVYLDGELVGRAGHGVNLLASLARGRYR